MRRRGVSLAVAALTVFGQIVVTPSATVSADPINPILDQSYGLGGVVAVPLANGFTGAVTSAPFGFAYVAGTYLDSSNVSHLTVSRFNSMGDLDSSFAGDGTATVPLPNMSGVDELVGLSDGTVLVLVEQQLFKFGIDGELDSGFASGGSLTLTGPGAGFCSYSPVGSMAVGSGGEIVVGGYVGGCGAGPLQSVLARLLPDGTLDPNFDDDGWKTWVVPGTNFGIATVDGISPDGRILVRGGCPGGGGRVCKILANGTPDPTFTEIQRFDANDIENAVLTSASGFFLVQFEDRVRFYFPDGQLNYYATTRFLEIDNEDQLHRKWVVMPNGAAFVLTSASGLWRYTANATLDYPWSEDGRDNTLLDYVLDVSPGTDSGGRALVLVQDGNSLRLVRLARQDRAFTELPPERNTGSQPGSEAVGDPVDTATGNFYDQWVDLASPVFGLSLMRSYNSRDLATGPMGAGWQFGVGPTVRLDGESLIVKETDGTQYRYLSDGSGGYVVPDNASSTLTLDPAPPSGDGELPMLRRTSTAGVIDRFDTAGRLIEQINWDSASAASTYVDGLLSNVTASNGSSLDFVYNSSGQLAEVTSSTGRTVGYDYANGRLSSFTNEFGATTSFGYDTINGLLETVLDPAGFYVVVNEYDAEERVVRQTGPTGGVLAFAYSPAEGVTEVTDSLTETTLLYHHDEDGRVVAVTDSFGNTAVRNFDSQGRQTSGVSRAGVTVSATYDNNDNPIDVTDAATGTTHFDYDSQNRVVGIVEPNGATTTYTYTGDARIPSLVIDPLGNTTTQTVVDGLVSSVTDADGVTVAFTYDTEKRVTSVIDELGNTTAYTYTPQGRPATITTPEGGVTTWTYDLNGRTHSVTAADGGVTSYTYDTAGRVLTSTDSTGAVTTNEYAIEVNGQLEPFPYLTRSTDSDGTVTTYTYDPHGNLIGREVAGAADSTSYGPLTRVESTTDALNRTTSYSYTDDGEIASVTAPNNAVTFTSYDTAGRVASTTDAMGRTTSVGYDSVGRVHNRVQPGGAATSYAYDVLGRVTSVTDERGGVTTTDYTPAGRVASVTDPAGNTVEYGYDSAGRQVSTLLPNGGVTTTTLDGEGRALSITSPEGLVTTFAYDPMGRTVSVIDPSGVVTQRTWSTRGELLTEKVGAQGTVTMTYTPGSDLASVTDALGNTTTFTYDDQGNLVERVNELGHVDSWSYDSADQLTSRTDALGRSWSYTYDDAGRMIRSVDPSGVEIDLRYSLDGRVASRADGSGTTIYEYDNAGRLRSLSGPDGEVVYTYNSSGDVLSRSVNGRSTHWTYDVAGRRTSMRYPSGESIVYGYNDSGQLATIRPGELSGDSFTQSQSAPLASKWAVSVVGNGSVGVFANALQLAVDNVPGDSVTAASRVAASANSDVAFTFDFSEGAGANSATLFAYTRWSSNNHYRLELRPGTTNALVVQKRGTSTVTLGSVDVPADGSVRVRLQVIGTQVRVRVWPAEEIEPEAWNASLTGTLTTNGTSRISLTRDSSGAAVSIDDWVQSNPSVTLPAMASYGYNLDGQVVDEVMPGGSRYRTFVNGRLASFSEALPGVSLNTTVTYDSTGRVSTENTGGLTTTYGYDAASQIATATTSAGVTTTWTYDALGRRTREQKGTAATNYVYDAAGQLCWTRPSALPANPDCATPPTNATVYAWDDAGRLLSEFRTVTNQVSYAYDLGGRLVDVERISGTTTTNQTRMYEPDGLLASLSTTKTTSTATTDTSAQFDWDPLNGLPRLAAWTDGAGITTDLISGPTGWLSIQKGLTGYAVAIDWRGSAVPATGTGSVARNASYDAFGTAAGAATFEPRLGYRGELTLDSALYLRARMYTPARGMFTTPDQAEGQPGVSTISHRYHYSDNNPTNRVDPTGLSSSGNDNTFNPAWGLVALVKTAPSVVGIQTVALTGGTATAATAAGGGAAAAAGATTGGAALGIAAIAVIGGVAIGCWIACDEYFEMQEYANEVRANEEHLANYQHVNGLVTMPAGVGAPPNNASGIAVCNVDEPIDDFSNDPINLHHSFPKFLGGPARFAGPSGGNAAVTPMPKSPHVRFHNELNEFLDPLGMRPSCINSGDDIRERFDKGERIKALEDFYRSPAGAKYTDVAKHFFGNMANPNFVAAIA